jgi:hypothetical protein
MTAAFATDGHPSFCGCAEYRQFVRGTFTRNGKLEPFFIPNPNDGPAVLLLPKPVSGSPLQDFQEDGAAGTVKFYGHRNDAPDPKGKYHNGNPNNPDQRSGCRYLGIDSPIMTGAPGELVQLDVEFRGVIIDAAADDEVIAEQFWAVSCAGVL